MARNVLITGCSKGLGLEFVKQMASDTRHFKMIFATARRHSDELDQVVNDNKLVHFIELDVSNEQSIKEAYDNVQQILAQSNMTLNCLINNAGINKKIAKFEWCTLAKMQEHFLVNVAAPTVMIKSFWPLLKLANSPSAMIVNMSSTLGSLQQTADAMWLPYRMSKTALNMLSVSLSKSLKTDSTNSPGPLVFSLHPGWVKTSMGGSIAPLSPQESISKMLSLLRNPKEEWNGKFIDYQGQTVPW